MSKLILQGQRVWAGTKRISSQISALNLSYGADPLDGTTLEDDTHIMCGGLKTTTLGYSGFVDYANADEDFFTNIGVSDVPIIITATNAAVGDTAYFFNSISGQYDTAAAIGELFKFDLSATGKQRPIRGVYAVAVSAVTPVGTSAPVQLSAVAAGQSLNIWAILSATTVDNTTLTVQSSPDVGFSSPTTVATIVLNTGAAQYDQTLVAGPITDTWYRVNYSHTVSELTDINIFLGVQ